MAVELLSERFDRCVRIDQLHENRQHRRKQKEFGNHEALTARVHHSKLRSGLTCCVRRSMWLFCFSASIPIAGVARRPRQGLDPFPF